MDGRIKRIEKTMDNNGPKFNANGNLIATVRPTALGKPKVDTTLQVAKAASKLFEMVNGEVKVPRKRATSEVWPEWFEELEAPKVIYLFIKDAATQIPVTYDEGTELFSDEEGNTYTGDNVVEYADPDAREVKGSMEALQQLRNAITRFNTKTGKKLGTRFVKAQRDSAGRTIEQTEMVYRLR